MNKSILMSIQPKWCELIASGKKTIEVRKTRPKLETPFKVYIYCCKPKKILRYVWTKKDYEGYPFAEGMDENEKVFCKIPDRSSPFCSSRYAGKVIGEFVCDEIDTVMAVDTPYFRYITVNDKMDRFFTDESRLNVEDLGKYLDFNTYGYAWHISDLKIYDKPKELSEFHKPCINTGSKICELCEFADFENTDILFPKCINVLTRPPQSYCYVEEVSE